MKINYLLFISCLFLFACKNEKQEQQASIQALETAAQDNADGSTLDTLLHAYQNYFTIHSNDKTLISKYKNNAKDLLTKRLTALRGQIFNQASGVINQQYADEFIRLSNQYARLLPTDKQTPDWLFQAGEMAGSLHRYDQTLELYEKINKDFPNYEKASQVLFMRAFTLDSELKQLDEAKALYEEFLQKYPKDDFADDAQFLLNNLGKSEDELIRSFQAKQQK